MHLAPDGRVRAANAAALRVLGVDELVGLSVARALSLLRDADGRHLSDAMVPGVTALTDAGAWETRAELGDAYIAASGYAYGRGVEGAVLDAVRTGAPEGALEETGG